MSNNQVKSFGIKNSQMLKDFAPRAVQRQTQHVKWSTRTHRFVSEMEENSETPVTKNLTENTTPKQMLVKR